MISQRKRLKIYNRDNWRCHYCRVKVLLDVEHEHPQRATLDHMHPASKGGTDEVNNLVTACHRCNYEKKDIPYESYRWFRHMLQRGHTREELLEALALVEEEDASREREIGRYVSAGIAAVEAKRKKQGKPTAPKVQPRVLTKSDYMRDGKLIDPERPELGPVPKNSLMWCLLSNKMLMAPNDESEKPKRKKNWGDLVVSPPYQGKLLNPVSERGA